MLRAQLSTMVFSRDKAVHCCFSCLRLYLLHKTLYKTTKSKYGSSILAILEASFWRLHCYCWARNLEKHQKWHHFEVSCFLGLEHFSYWTKERGYRQLAEGLVYGNSLVSSFQVFLFGRYCQKYLKISWFLAIFCGLGVTRIVTIICIDDITSFLSQLRSL